MGAVCRRDGVPAALLVDEVKACEMLALGWLSMVIRGLHFSRMGHENPSRWLLAAPCRP